MFDLVQRWSGLDELEAFGWAIAEMFSPDPESVPDKDRLIEIWRRCEVLRTVTGAATGVPSTQEVQQ